MMTAWVLMFGCNLLTPLLMAAIGEIFLRWPPRDINALIGYRTRRSMSSQEAWNFAQRRMALCWRRMGWWMVPAVVAGMLPLLGRADDSTVYGWGMAIMTLELAVMVMSILPVERALRGAFNEDGTRKERVE